jgi:hypothetical protein
MFPDKSLGHWIPGSDLNHGFGRVAQRFLQRGLGWGARRPVSRELPYFETDSW